MFWYVSLGSNNVNSVYCTYYTYCTYCTCCYLLHLLHLLHDARCDRGSTLWPNHVLLQYNTYCSIVILSNMFRCIPQDDGKLKKVRRVFLFKFSQSQVWGHDVERQEREKCASTAVPCVVPLMYRNTSTFSSLIFNINGAYSWGQHGIQYVHKCTITSYYG